MRLLLFLLVLALPALSDEAAVEKRCAELTADIEKLLGPKFKAPVPVRIVDKEFIATFARETEEKQTPKHIRDISQRLFERFKLVPKGFDVMAAQLELLKVSVAGLYDPEKDCFYVVGNQAKPGTMSFDITAAHELAHAYRDVDKDYWGQVLRSFLTDEDKAIAITCLVEGDATIIGNALGQGLETRKSVPLAVKTAKMAPLQVPAAMSSPMLKKFPLFMREMLITRYFIGQAFAAHVYEKGGWPALDKAYDNPPVSTEQILHPEKYLGPKFDTPTRIEGGDPSAALGEGWKTEYANTLGEFLIRVHFTESFSRKSATRTAEGWDGGRYFVCAKKGEPLFVGVITVWDSEDDAIEFYAAWKAWAGLRDDPSKDRAIDPAAARVQTEDGLVVLRRVGTAVYIADGVPADRADAVMKSLGSAKLIP